MIGEDRIVTDELKTAIDRVQSTGAFVSIATGRTLTPALRIARESGAAGPVICFQGAMTYEQESNTTVRHEMLGAAESEIAIKTMSRVVSELMMFLGNDVWVEKRSEWTDGYGQRMGVDIRDTDSLLEMSDRRPTAIVGVGDPEIIEPLVHDLHSRMNGTALVTHSLPMFCEVEAIGAGKDLAIESLAASLGIDQQSVIAVGDGKGDQSMIEWAGLGVAIEGGHPDAVDVSDLVIATPEQSGLVNFLNDLVDRRMFAGSNSL